jgi:F-type H+-transporting ATPase subunit b
MNALLLFAFLEAQSEGQIAQIARTFGVDWSHLVSQIISFSIVCILLYLLAYKPVLRMLNERRQLIAQGLANSEKIRAELAKTEAQREEVLAQANAQASQFLEEARGAAARLREQETQKATAAAEQIMARAREASAADHTQMLAQLKREVGRLVVQTTAAITGKILSTDDQRRLSEETAKELTTR